MPDPIINRSALQPTTLFRDVDLNTGALGKPSVGVDVGAVGLGGRKIELTTPRPIHGVVGGRDGGVRGLAELNLQSASPGQIGQRQRDSGSVLNAMVNSIERLRSDNGGTLPVMGQTLREHLDLLTDAYELLNSGPMVGDSLSAQMEDLDGVAEALEKHIADTARLMPDEVRAEVEALTGDVVAQLKDRVSYLGHTVTDSPLSASKMYESKAQISEAAARVIDQALARDDLTPKQRTQLEKARDDIFKARAGQLRGDAHAHRGELGDPKEIVGRKPMGWLKQILMPHKSIPQAMALSGHVNDLLSRGATSSNTARIDEQTVIEATLARVFKEAGLSAGQVGHDLHDAMNQVFNDQPWPPIVKEIQLQTGTETLFAYSEITPAGNFIDAYGGKGFNAHSITEHQHAVNLARSQLADGQGQVLFSGMRHGVVSAFGINAKEVAKMGDEALTGLMRDLLADQHWVKGDNGERDVAATLARVRADASLVDGMRRKANENRAEEIVVANLITDEALLRAAVNGETVQLDILSISLLTPDHVRKSTNSNEQLMLRDQVQAWKDVSGERVVTVKHPDTGETLRVKVNVNAIPCNYGVNQGAVKGVGPFSSTVNLISGWDDVAGINGEAVGALLGGDVRGLAGGGMPGGLLGERMQGLADSVRQDREALAMLGDRAELDEFAPLRASLHANEQKLAQALELARQIGEIQQDGSFKKAGGEPYKMPARLAVLADMFGVKVAFNCKSGKDRTGELDAEIKHLRLQMALSGGVPRPTRTRSPQEIAHFHEVVTHSGNFEMQRLNTGYAGYKLKGVPELYAQFGGSKGDDVTANFLGLSNYTAS